jgi:hypothetical protein
VHGEPIHHGPVETRHVDVAEDIFRKYTPSQLAQRDVLGLQSMCMCHNPRHGLLDTNTAGEASHADITTLVRRWKSTAHDPP